MNLWHELTDMADPSWIQAELTTLAAAHQSGRMPHALLIHEAPGSGGDWLAQWTARLVLCQSATEAQRRESREAPVARPGATEAQRRESREAPVARPGATGAPCGACPGCHRVLKAQHPDLLLLQPIEDSRQIRIEQVRELSQELALTAHQGAYKVAIISPADTLNRFAANALLKTLEEPPPRTLLMLVVTQPSRLPATILSRCQRVRLRAPARQEAVSWLEASKGAGDWNAVLDTLGDAPMLAADVDPKAVVQVGQEVRRALEEATTGAGDPVATAERWSRADFPLRLRCIENWLTERIRAHCGSDGFLTKVGAAPYPGGRVAVLNMGDLFELVDSVRELKSSLDSPINRGLALEVILRRFVPGRVRG